MNKEETYAFLKENNIKFEAVEHKAVFNMDELGTIELPHPEWEAKTFLSVMIKSGTTTLSPLRATSVSI